MSNRRAEQQLTHESRGFRDRGVAPRDTTLGDIAKAAAPYLLCDLLLFILLVVFPSIALFLPGLMA